MTEQAQLPRVFVDFNNSDRQGRVRLNCVGTLQDLSRLGVVLREGTEILLSSYELEAYGTAAYSAEEGLWVAKFDSDNIRELPGNR
jgi:hypothetical protein